MNEEILKFVEKRTKVKGAYGYGSGVFKQLGYTDKDKPQIDLILVVDDLKKWHLDNIKKNPKDYSFIGKLFFKYGNISSLKGLTGITYLSNIHENGLVFKYGTIEEKDLLKYLSTWESFYLPGRFQKRILPVIEDKKVTSANNINRDKVLYTSLLTIDKDKVDLIDVYTGICGLSYLGDTRMKFAENPKKVSNIVLGSLDEFKNIYGTSNKYFKLNKDNSVTINSSVLLDDIDTLPSSLLNYIDTIKNSKDLNEIREKILEYFTLLNKKESTKQTIKGIFTNGVVRSIKYAGSKVMKKIKN